MKAQEHGDSSDCSEPSMDALMLRVKERDLLAFAQLYCRMLPAIKRKAASEGWQNSADDIAHDVFLRVLESPDRYDGQRPAQAYLLGIAHNVIRERRRACAKDIPLVDQLPEPAIEHDLAAAMERAELMEMLVAARLELSENQAAALEMVYDDGIRPRRAANQLGCTEEAIRLRLRKAQQKLRHLLRARTQLTMLPSSVFGYLRRCLADVRRPCGRQVAIRVAGCCLAGIGAMSLILLSQSHIERTPGHQMPEHGSSPPLARPAFSGEGAPSPAANVELRAKWLAT